LADTVHTAEFLTRFLSLL